MMRPQAIVNPLTRAAIFLVLTIDEGGEGVVRQLLTDLQGLRRSVGFRVPDSELDCVVGIGSDAWDRLFTGPRPKELHPFVELAGEPHAAVSTPGDLLFHVRGREMDLCFELGTKIVSRLRGAASVVDETHGFRSFEQRDLLGFVDGTENPEDSRAVQAAIVADQDPDFAGGSYVVVQKYLHDMDAWDSLTVESQEDAVGRTKLHDFEMPDDVKPPNSHVALNDLDDDPDGTPREILRANMPFGSLAAQEFGTYFIGYAARLEVTEQMLRHMFLGDGGAAHDRLLDFSRAVTGSVFFCPSLDFLDDLPAAPA